MRVPLLLFAGLVLCGVHSALPAPPSAESKKLVQELKSAELSKKPTEETVLAQARRVSRLLELKGAAIPYLLPLLRDPNEHVRAVASSTLAAIEGLKEEHLDALIESRRRGEEWSATAIARIGTSRAVSFLVQELFRERQGETTLTEALQSLGDKAVPEVVALYERERGWDTALEYSVQCVLARSGLDAAGAVEPLMKMATDPAASVDKRARAIRAVGVIRSAAAATTDRLQALRKSPEVALQKAATDAIIMQRGEAAAPLLAERLERAAPDDHFIVLGQIAECGAKGRAAGPAVLKLLQSKDWSVREAAVRTLGEIDYAEAEAELRAQLASAEDWRLVYCAVEALGRFRARGSLEALDQVAGSYWFAPVRELAQTAADALREGRPFQPLSGNGMFANLRYAEVQDRLSEDDASLLKVALAPSTRAPLPAAIQNRLRSKVGAKNGFTCLKLESGYLVGTDRGEFGGELQFFDEQGGAHEVLTEITHELHPAPGGAVAMCGLAHLSSNYGMAYRVTRNAAREWEAAPWRRLPGAPIFSRALQEGGWLVACIGGIVTISPSGEMKSLSRQEALYARDSEEGRKLLKDQER